MKSGRVSHGEPKPGKGRGDTPISVDRVAVSPDLKPSARGSSAIAVQLRRAITSDAYVSGDQIPAEREIARKFGASRTAVRNALRTLEKQKLITRKIGSGTFVVYDGLRTSGEIAEITSPLELIEVRLALEPHIVRLVVLHGTARDMSSLAGLLDKLEASQSDHESFSEADQNFHLGLATATHNPLIVWMYERINDVRRHAQWKQMKDKILVLKRIVEYNISHRLICEAVNRRDADSAIELITAHLMEARRDLLGANST